MDTDVNNIIDTVVDLAASTAGIQGAEETDEPGLFETLSSITDAADLNFISIIGDIGSGDSFLPNGLEDAANSFANVINTALSGSDTVSLLDINNIGSAVKGLA